MRARASERERVQKSSSHVILILCFHFPTENVYYIIIIILCFCVAVHSPTYPPAHTRFLCFPSSSLCAVHFAFVCTFSLHFFVKILLPSTAQHSTIIITCNSCFGIAMNRLKICVADTRSLYFSTITPCTPFRQSKSFHLQCICNENEKYRTASNEDETRIK